MSLDFEGKVAIVTGSGGGIGKGYALELGKRGAKVVDDSCFKEILFFFKVHNF